MTQSKIGRDDWLRWAGSLLIHVVVTVASTGLTNYFVLQSQVQLLNAKLESQTLLWDVQFRALSKQCDELKAEIHELRSMRLGLEQRAAIDALGACGIPFEAADFLDVSPYATAAVDRSKSLVVVKRPRVLPTARGPPATCVARFLQVSRFFDRHHHHHAPKKAERRTAEDRDDDRRRGEAPRRA